MPEITIIYITIPVGKGLEGGISVVGLTNYVKEVPFFVTLDFDLKTPRRKGLDDTDAAPSSQER
jgi:hypothetical protein